ncbi:DUF3903 domain-containing protein [Bacillus cereus]|uniref:DUF3903 domain-containing protein n=1 Tax=Bacillus arachidis TaxID=2819290 RepID=A0ABS3P4V2_9BACI|nr:MULTISPECIES: DUF3903 domain-containing protein [Bacillus]PEY32982.1 DUF3903 domain-containing protein [Bacillus cereus]MBO1628150.1 DUF3903 domain-containing protein [Bacillus arachidis]WIY59749.1 DUF3903 domain-containing protein [Bacillus arachidis]WJE51068.1 DUF3903 domain-containing protein [Bacillus cereus]SDY37095.1 protein of unknown function [Bacillus sp. 166amftsu]
MISKYVVECVFCEENRKSRRATVTVSATSHALAVQKVTDECKRRFGKTLLLQTEITEELVGNKKES